MAAAISACPFIFTLLLLSATTTSAHNITNILSSSPDYTLYSDLLTKTKVADDINSRQTITVLVLTNSVVKSALHSQPLDVLKALLSIHVLLDYFDVDTKLKNITGGSVISTTLYQTSGVAKQRNGFVNITDSDGKVLFATATQGSKPNSVFVKSVKAVPYNISVVEISAPIDAPGVLNPSPSKDVNLTAALKGAGSKIFANLIAKAKVLQDFEAARVSGLTVFAPRDDAWKGEGLPDWTRLSDNDLQTLLRYHAAPNYFPIATLKGMKNEFSTLATVGADKFAIIPEASGDFVLLKTGVNSGLVVSTILDSAPVSLFIIDNVLLPVELFGNPSILPPSASPIPHPSPASPTPSAQPGAPPASTPKLAPPAGGPSLPPPSPTGEVPAAAPAADEDHGKKKKNGGPRESPEAIYGLIMAMVVAIVSSSLI